MSENAARQEPKVTRGEELLYSTDLAPVVRLTGAALTPLRQTLELLGVYIEEHCAKCAGPDETPETAPSYVKQWREAFSLLAPLHDGLLDAYRDVAKIGISAARDFDTPRPDPESGRFEVTHSTSVY
jgi:hypothetical protein